MYMSHSKHIAAYVLSQDNKVLCCSNLPAHNNSNLNKHTVMKSVPHSGLLINCTLDKKMCQTYVCYEGYSKINLRLVGKNKRVVIASKRTLSSNKELLFLLYAYPHAFSPRSVGVNTDRTWTLSSPLPPAVRYVL